MENTISSRKNRIIAHIKALSADRAYRRCCGEYVCDGAKLYGEAQSAGAEITAALWLAGSDTAGIRETARNYVVSRELLDYVSPLKNSPGPVFILKTQSGEVPDKLRRVIVLDGVQDPGNVGTVIRSADAFGADAVILTGSCADAYNTKTVRAAMGALLRVPVLELGAADLAQLLDSHKLPLYGAVLSDTARDIRELDLRHGAVAVGSEGAGLSAEIRDMCAYHLTIPIGAHSESLNAAVAASVILWEMAKAAQ